MNSNLTIKINGVEVSGIRNLAEAKNLIKELQAAPTELSTEDRTKHEWSDEESKLLLDNLDKMPRHLHQLIPSRKIIACGNRRHLMLTGDFMARSDYSCKKIIEQVERLGYADIAKFLTKKFNQRAKA